MKNFYLILLLLLFVSCKKHEKVDEKQEDFLKVTKYIKINSKENKVNYNQFSAVIESSIESKLSFRVSGTIDKKNVFLGDFIKKGQVLATLDNIEYQLNYERAIAELEKSKANLLNARQNYNRIKNLYFNNNSSKADFDNALAQLDSAKADYKASLKNVEYNKIQLKYTKLTSPINGYISSEDKNLGETVQKGESVYSVVSSEKLQTTFSIPESLINDIHLNDNVTMTIDAFKGKKFEAYISNIGSSSNNFGNTFPVKATLLKEYKGVKSGMSAKIYLKKKNNNIIIPTKSVMTDSENNNYVFLVKDIENNIGTVVRRDISVGELYNSGIEVTSGLKDNDILITGGMTKTIIGEKVQIVSEVID